MKMDAAVREYLAAIGRKGGRAGIGGGKKGTPEMKRRAALARWSRRDRALMKPRLKAKG